NQTLTAGVYCDPDQLIATAGQSDSGAANTKYGHHPFTETDEQLYNVAAVDGATVGLTKDAAAAFEKMQKAAASQGLDIKAVSGFRSRKLQEELFSDQVAKQGGSLEAAAKISAPAGHSEHHTGLAVDVGNNANPYLNESWANTPEYAWMQQNAG
ncbi:M15 family metallopeptidase, partial [Acaryochloris marina NIES-2412]|uniref:M15 family metallopeptidase n=1 Tax=Acaryochloris marina TaxID=155978 RepID=UPI004059B2C7